MRRRWVRNTLLVVIAVIVIAIGGFVIWGLTPLGPEQSALDALQGSDAVAVADAPEGWVFAPRSSEPTVGLVFYPGGRVDARSYAPLASLVAERGYLVVIRPMPLSLAVLSPNAADAVIEAHPEVESWSVGGHSLGGAMAAQYVAKNASRIDGLVLLGAYASGEADLSATDVAALDLWGTLDGVLDQANHTAGNALLPPDRISLPLEGGNHAQFGDYGPQPGDNPATITAEQQWQRTAEQVDLVLTEATSR